MEALSGFLIVIGLTTALLVSLMFFAAPPKGHPLDEKAAWERTKHFLVTGIIVLAGIITALVGFSLIP